MAMLSSYTLPSLALAHRKFSSAALQLCKQPATSSSSQLTLPWAPCKVSPSQARSFTCHAHKNKYDIQPTALVHPSILGGDHSNWSITEDTDHITVKLNVGELGRDKDKLEVSTIPQGQGLLVIKYTGDSNDETPVSSLDVRLLMPPGYDVNKVKASIMPNGNWLEVTIARPQLEPTKIPIN